MGLANVDEIRGYSKPGYVQLPLSPDQGNTYDDINELVDGSYSFTLKVKNIHVKDTLFEERSKIDLGSGNQTLSAMYLLENTIHTDPEGNANWTIDTAENIVAAITSKMGSCRTNTKFRVLLYNAATAASSEIVTIVAGTGITLYGDRVTLTEGTNRITELLFIVTSAISGSEAVDCYILY